MSINWVSFSILLVLFAVVTFVGFAATRWRRAENMLHLNEWGLGGRGFGTFVTWFLLGGDLYTAYTFIAVPALVFGTGSAGFFTLSYTIMVFPIAFIFLPGNAFKVPGGTDETLPEQYLADPEPETAAPIPVIAGAAGGTGAAGSG